MSDTELQQLIIYVGTTAKIDAAQQAGIITENDLAVSTDAPDFQEKLNKAQMNAVNSGITAQLVSLYNGHIDDSTIHVTQQDKTNWNGKQNALNSEQLDAVNSGITSTGVSQITTNENNIATITPGANAGATALQPSDVIDNTSSSVTNKPLSANMGKSLQDQIDNMNGRGRFLALWNCATGLAQTNPPQTTYTYKAGDYFIVGTVAQSGGTNYRPSGSSYTTGVPSTVVETADVAVNDVYYYDGSTWALQINTQKELSFVNIAGDPYDNTNLASALNGKVPTTRTVNGKALSADISLNADDVLPSQSGNANKYLRTDGTNAYWGTLPSNIKVYNYSGNTYQGIINDYNSGILLFCRDNSGKYVLPLVNCGTVLSMQPMYGTPHIFCGICNNKMIMIKVDLNIGGGIWSYSSTDIIPNQSGNSGKFLTTNGSAVSWATVDALPTQSGQSGKFLTTDGTTASWDVVNAGIFYWGE